MPNTEVIAERQLSLPEPFLESLDWTPGAIKTGVKLEGFLSQVYNSPISLALAMEGEGEILFERFHSSRPTAFVTESGSAKLIRNNKYLRLRASEYLAIISKFGTSSLYAVDVIIAYPPEKYLKLLENVKGKTQPLTNLIAEEARRITEVWEETFPQREVS